MATCSKIIVQKGSSDGDGDEHNGIMNNPKISVSIYNPTEKIKQQGGAEITVREFLDFLKTAYQVHDNLEGVLIENGMPEAVDWIRLKESELVKPRSIAIQTSDSKMLKSEDKKGKVRRFFCN